MADKGPMEDEKNMLALHGPYKALKGLIRPLRAV